jgi:mannose-6-phosphate isomerase-like protein (cupin superfamily)
MVITIEVPAAVSHRTVQEIWYVVAGDGRTWRSQAGSDEVTRSVQRMVLIDYHQII